PPRRRDIAGNLLPDALGGQRPAQLGHHDRVAPHPHIGADVAQLNIPQTRLPLLVGHSSCSALVVILGLFPSSTGAPTNGAPNDRSSMCGGCPACSAAPQGL